MTEKRKDPPPIEKIMKPFQEFTESSTSGGILLLIATIIALFWANSAWADSYFHLWHTHLKIGFGNVALDYSLHHWINDGLMVIFFFVVGLEIKRELIVGELSSAKKAALPVAGAIGGMLLPAAIYIAFNAGSEGASGWGIPMATDIAFVIGLMALLGSSVPLSIKVFVTALAIADDIGAVLVIAFFYTAEISITSLGIGFVILVILFLMNRMGVRNLLIYVILGIGLWLAFLKSGVHATVAGVLLAFTIPVRSRYNTRQFLDYGKELMQKFDDAGEEGPDVLSNEKRQSIVQTLESNCRRILTPLQRFEHGLEKWVALFIMPVFALANAGVSLSGDVISSITNPISIGIILGLFIGKQLGIFLFSWLSIKFGIASKPAGVSWGKIYGAGILAGIGFTMSLFIANLAFMQENLLNISKVGILTASLISGLVGFLFLKLSPKKSN